MIKKRRGYKARSPLKKALRVASKAKAKTRVAKVAHVETLAKSINRMKLQLRKETEMKQYTPVDLFANTVGQVDVNNSGARAFDLEVCKNDAGLANDQRIGLQTHLKGIFFRFQVTTQAQSEIANSLIFEVWKTSDFGGSLTAVIGQIYDNDSISGVVDANSTYNKEFIKSKVNPNGLFQMVGRRVCKIYSDNRSGELVYRDFKMFIKQNQLLSYAGNSNQAPLNIRYILVIRAQNGNRNTATPSTLSTIPIQVTNSGALVRFQHTDYYVDK